ncbi:MAG: S8 family serine peptidase, partial [Acidimicrobiia bacterium]|nr:S8 family serine peptidase [Acidimicrobiia bacterium]
MRQPRETQVNTMKKIIFPVTTAALLLCALLVADAVSPVGRGAVELSEAGAASFIVQAETAERASRAVAGVRGAVTHTLPIINGVGARLTEDQARRLSASAGVRQVVPNRSARVSACQAVAGDLVGFDGNRFEWEITNLGASALTVNAFAALWPEENQSIKKVRLDSYALVDELLPQTTAVITSGWRGQMKDRLIPAGKTVALELEFEEDLVTAEQLYRVIVGFEEGCWVQFTPSAATCQVSGHGWRELKDNKIKWELYNVGETTATLSGISVNWPDSNGDLVKMKLEGATFMDGPRKAPVTSMRGGWLKSPKDRLIEPWDSGKLELEFATDIDVDPERYSIKAEFYEGCEVDFVPAAIEVEFDKRARDTGYPYVVGADLLQGAGVTGRGVTVAIVDTGMWTRGGGQHWLRDRKTGEPRVLAAYDAIRHEVIEAKHLEDSNGHGTHVASILGSSRKARTGHDQGWSYNGIAPGADLIVVRAFGEDGSGSYLDIIEGLQFVLDNKDAYGIRVLNLSFSAEPQSFYWDDPLAQAVMAAWRAGIVVVASAGNGGPDPFTIGIPGSVPYVVTVGAMTDNYTP